MDSSHPQCISSSNRKSKATDSVMVTCKRAKFMATYYQQNFSMPDSVFYIATNPKTPTFYLKMVKTCKYFFVKNPIIVIPDLYARGGKWCSDHFPLNLTKYNSKYWITEEIYGSANEFVDKNIFSPIIPEIYQCDVKRLFLSDQIISYHDLSLIISSAERIKLTNVIVKHSDSSDAPLEDIVAVAVNAKSVIVDKPTITLKTIKELTKLPNFKELDGFTLYDLSEVFDICEFYGYMKKNQHTKIYISFDEQISDAFKDRLKTIVDEILETKHNNYKPPLIKFYGVDIQKFVKLCRICSSH